MSPPVALAAAPNGGRRTRADHPALPLGPAELAVDAAACAEAGAAMVHVHVRDAAGRHVLDAAAFRAATDAIRRAVGDRLVIQATTESLGTASAEEQEALVRELRPESASLGLRELAPDAAGAVRLGRLVAWCRTAGVLPQLIVYDAAEATRLADLVARGVMPPAPVLVVLGRFAADGRGRPAELAPLVAAAGRTGPLMACAFGPEEAACARAAAALGVDMRVGLENNLHLPDGSLAPTNAALVAATADVLRADGHRLATADELRARWG